MRVNWVAIVLAGVADWILGAVWFTAFSNQWKAGLQMPQAEMERYAAHPNFWPYLASLVCSIGIAYVIARILAYAQTHGVFRGISTGILVGFAAAAAMVTEMVFEVKPRPFILISAGYPLIGCILMGIILGAWKPKASITTGTDVRST